MLQAYLDADGGQRQTRDLVGCGHRRLDGGYTTTQRLRGSAEVKHQSQDDSIHHFQRHCHAEQSGSDGFGGGRTSDMFFPEEAKEDRWRVQLIPPPSTSRPVTAKPDYSDGSRSKAMRKRKLKQRGDEEEPSNDDEWTESANGKWSIKRIRKHLIRKPVEEIPESDSSEPASPEHGQQNASTQLLNEASSPPKQTTPKPVTKSRQTQPEHTPLQCEGPAVAAGLRKLTSSKYHHTHV